ncbi:MAG: hypothetical protein WCX88_02495 [Patescibacteria group bacterium]
MTEELKKKMAEGRAKAKLAKTAVLDPPIQSDLKQELDDFKQEVRKQNDSILGILEKIVNKDEPVAPLAPVEEKTEESIVDLSPKQKEIFEYYFDITDGFKAWYDVNNNIFTIEVPMNMSNTNEAYRALYKQDLRSKKVDSNNILGSIKEWCILVASNLKYERRIRLKN